MEILHLANNEPLLKRGMPGYNKIGKVKDFMNILARNYEAEYCTVKFPLMKLWLPTKEEFPSSSI